MTYYSVKDAVMITFYQSSLSYSESSIILMGFILKAL